MTIWKRIRDAAVAKLRDPRTLRDAAFSLAIWIARKLITKRSVLK